MIRSGIKLALAFALLASAPLYSAKANPIDQFGFGPRSVGMGQAQTAAADDLGAVYYNPALLARFKEIRIDAGYNIAMPVLKLNGRDVNNDNSKGFAIGIAAPGEFGPVKIGAGVALFIPDNQLTRVRVLPPGTPRFALLHNRPQRLLLAATGAITVGDRLSLGGGVSYMSNTSGDVTLDGRVGFPNADDSDLAIDIDFELRAVRTIHAGVAFEISPDLLVGASYRHRFQLQLQQRFLVAADVGGAGVNPIIEDGFLRLFVTSLDLFQPMQINAGTSWRVHPRLEMAFDLSYQRWSDFENPAARLEIDVDVGDFNNLVDIPDPLVHPDPNFKDIWVPRIGVEWQAYRDTEQALLARAGYIYEPTPAPEQRGQSNLVDNDKHTLSLGAGWELPVLQSVLLHPVTIDVAFAAMFLPSREHRKTNPVDAFGDYRSSGAVYQFVLGSRWKF